MHIPGNPKGIVVIKVWAVQSYYSGNDIRHSLGSGNPGLDWMPDQIRQDIRYM